MGKRRVRGCLIAIVSITAVFCTFTQLFLFHFHGTNTDFGVPAEPMVECASQNFRPVDERTLRHQMVGRFAPVVYLHSDEPLGMDDIYHLYQILPVEGGYQIIYAFVAERDFVSGEWVLASDFLVNITFGVTPAALGVRLLDILELNEAHNGDIESVIVTVQYHGRNELDDLVYQMSDIRIKQHTFYTSVSLGNVRCEDGAHPVFNAAQGKHTLYTYPRTCVFQYNHTRDTLIGQVKGAFDTCNYGERMPFVVRREFEVTVNGRDILGEPILSEQFPNESLMFPTFCGGHREFEGQRCKARYPFVYLH